MEHVMYERVVLHAKDAADGETPSKVMVTHERNGYVVWTYGATQGERALGFWSEYALGIGPREQAIEHAVDLTKQYLNDQAAAGRL